MILISLCAIRIKGPKSEHIVRNMKLGMNIVTKKFQGIKSFWLTDKTTEKTFSLFITINTPLNTWKQFNGNMNKKRS